MNQHEVKHLFVESKVKPDILVNFDKSSERRPAWIQLDDRGIMFATVVGENETTHYMLTESGLMIPINATAQEQFESLRSEERLKPLTSLSLAKLRLKSVYEKVSAEHKSGISFDKNGKNRPAWVNVPWGSDPENLIKFLSVSGEDGETIAYYKLRVGDYYLPLNASSEEEHHFHSIVAKEFDEINSANKQIGEFIVSKLNELNIDDSGQELLDLYCATGMTAEMLQPMGFSKTTLLDFSQEMIDVAKCKPELEAAEAIVGNFFEWKTDQSFGVITCVMGMHYHEGDDLRRFLSKVSEILDNEGLFICAQPSAPSELKQYFEMIDEGVIDFNNKGKTTKLPYFIGRKLREPSR